MLYTKIEETQRFIDFIEGMHAGCVARYLANQMSEKDKAGFEGAWLREIAISELRGVGLAITEDLKLTLKGLYNNLTVEDLLAHNRALERDEEADTPTYMRDNPKFSDYLSHLYYEGREKENNSLRFGQQAFNLLFKMKPEMADRIRGGGLDPFQIDERMPRFLDFVKDDWDELFGIFVDATQIYPDGTREECEKALEEMRDTKPTLIYIQNGEEKVKIPLSALSVLPV